jgi:hypothetical protein
VAGKASVKALTKNRNEATARNSFIGSYIYCLPIPVTALSKAWVCGHSLAGIVGSNPTWGMDVWLY